nr:dolichyl-phosphate beta-glucosyltransferase [Methanosarcina horonobensis]
MLPAYNEVARIEKTVNQTAETLKDITSSFEIIIAEDGSSDGTDRVADNLAMEHSYVSHLHSDSRQGRGMALNRALKYASGDVLCYIDVDLATDMSHLKELIESISLEGYDFATGSRMMPQSNVKRPLKRDIASKGYNFLVRIFLHSKLYDHQCGFKAFKKAPLFELIDTVQDKHWFWDTELMVLAQSWGFKIKEFPVVWRHGGATKVNLKKDILGMGSQIFRLRRSLEKQSKKKAVKSCEGCFEQN